MENRRIVLSSRPVGVPNWSNFELRKESISKTDIGNNGVLVRSHLLSIDPSMRIWMNDATSYLPPVGINEVMRAIGLGQVVASNNPTFKVGDFVSGFIGLQELFLSRNGKELQIFHYDSLPVPRTAFLSVLGMTGLTAYFGLLRVGLPKEGECLLVSAAAGATGSVVGQIGKIFGCYVVGLAGSDEKCSWLIDELGFDGAINYKSHESLVAEIRRLCPKGVDIYFDNVGGSILDDALACISSGARVVLCGAISQYNSKDAVGPKRYLSLIVNRARMEGFLVTDFSNEFDSARRQIGEWIVEGKLKWHNHVVEGLENAVNAISMLFNGKNTGKIILDVSEGSGRPRL